MVIIGQINQFQITPIALVDNHPITRNIEDDHHAKEIHETSHKTDIVYHIVEIVNTEIIIQDQNQTNLNFRLMQVPIQTLEIETLQISILKLSH